jgi:hypothetical protein
MDGMMALGIVKFPNPGEDSIDAASKFVENILSSPALLMKFLTLADSYTKDRSIPLFRISKVLKYLVDHFDKRNLQKLQTIVNAIKNKKRIVNIYHALAVVILSFEYQEIKETKLYQQAKAELIEHYQKLHTDIQMDSDFEITL